MRPCHYPSKAVQVPYSQCGFIILAMVTIHISEEDAARDFADLMAHVRAGGRVIIEENASPVAVLQPALRPDVRLLSDSLKLAKAHGSAATLDDGFARDLEAVVTSHAEALSNPWD